jgi:hypothetical protein
LRLVKDPGDGVNEAINGFIGEQGFGLSPWSAYLNLLECRANPARGQRDRMIVNGRILGLLDADKAEFI